MTAPVRVASSSRFGGRPFAIDANVVRCSLEERWRSLLGYGVGLALMIVWVMAIFPSVQNELGDYADAMPEAMRSLFGMEDIAGLAGFVHAEIFSLMGPIVFCAFAISAGSAAIAGDERDQILSIVLSTGVGRRSLLLSKTVALIIQEAALGAITFGAIAIGSPIAGGGIDVVNAVAATVQLAALGMVFGVGALAVGAATGRRSTAAVVGGAFGLATYLLDALAGLVSWLEPLQAISPFHWYAPGNPLVDGFSATGLLLLVAASLVLTVVAVVRFDRRDIRS